MWVFEPWINLDKYTFFQLEEQHTGSETTAGESNDWMPYKSIEKT